MSELLEKLDDGLLTLTLNRPERRNAMTQSLSDALSEAIGRAAQDPNVRCLVLTGAGTAFCAGGDMGGDGDKNAMSYLTDESVPLEARTQSIRESMDMFRVLHEMPKPTLAIINGAAAGAGLVLALACDMRFCLDTAKLTTAFARIGTSGDSGVSYFLPRIVGMPKALELMFTSDVLTGRDALKMGLVTKVASKETFEAESQAFAHLLADLPTIAIGYMKENIFASLSSTLSETLDREAERMIHTLGTDDHKQAVNAFLNKSKPSFKGR